MSNLSDLSAELLAEIFKLIHDSSRHTIFSLLGVNKRVSEAALPFVYRESTFNYTATARDKPTDTEKPVMRTFRQLDSLLALPKEHTIWKSVRKVAVYSSFVQWPDDTSEPSFTPSEETVQDRWGSFTEFLSRIVNLRELVFDCTERVPIILLAALETNHPSCHLRVRNWTRLRPDAPFGDPYEEALARSPVLKSIEANFVYENWLFTSASYEVDALERILALSPSLEEVGYSNRPAYPGAPVIVQVGQEGEDEEAERRREAGRFRVGEPVQKTTVRKIKTYLSQLKLWEAFIDLENIETLDIGRISDSEWLKRVMEQRTFSGLKHLAFKIAHLFLSFGDLEGEFKMTLDAFISSLPPLESLSVVSYHEFIDLSSVLSHHGVSLRSLSLHQVEDIYESRPILALDDLKLIRSECPHLEHFEFDINRTPNPKENEMVVYTFLSFFKSLRSIYIHYDVGEHHQGFESDFSLAEFKEIYTVVDEDFAREVWRAVCANHLEELVLHVGERDWEIRSDELCARKRIRVCRNERDDLRDDWNALQIVEGW
ncbi:hypothetical protein PM082_021638 [Marasmius tenuissimus]|nr:hypothetical protein PM082_021638 [Marasmius tenuissimus]